MAKFTYKIKMVQTLVAEREVTVEEMESILAQAGKSFEELTQDPDEVLHDCFDAADFGGPAYSEGRSWEWLEKYATPEDTTLSFELVIDKEN